MICKHSIASMDVSMKSNTLALQNIKQRIWQAVMNLKGYWSFTTFGDRIQGGNVIVRDGETRIH